MPADELKNLLNPSNNGDLGQLIRRARDMGALTDRISLALPDEQSAGIVAANLREDGELVVIAASSAWASRLRFEAESLLQAAQSMGVKAHTCRIRVCQS